MGVYNKTLQPYNLLRKFRANDGTEWDKTSELLFWMRANRSRQMLDVSKNPAVATIEGTLASAQGPDSSRFEIDSIEFNNSSVTIPKGQLADASDNKSIIWGGWIYLNVHPSSGSNNGFPILSAVATPSFTVFVDDHCRLNVRLSDYVFDNPPESATVRTVGGCIP